MEPTHERQTTPVAANAATPPGYFMLSDCVLK
jgi:hypothetical protein